jgi:hypothetical protein
MGYTEQVFSIYDFAKNRIEVSSASGHNLVIVRINKT